jgi:hypothetical protein
VHDKLPGACSLICLIVFDSTLCSSPCTVRRILHGKEKVKEIRRAEFTA